MKKISLQKYSRGYTLLFAVITATVVLGVAAFILGISRKQSILASVARESTYAIYAADSGIECAVAASSGMSSSSQPDILCNGQVVSAGTTTALPLPGATQVQSWAYSAISLTGGQCAIVILTTARNSRGDPEIILDSRGYNVCKTSGGILVPDSAGSRTVERAQRVIYTGFW